MTFMTGGPVKVFGWSDVTSEIRCIGRLGDPVFKVRSCHPDNLSYHILCRRPCVDVVPSLVGVLVKLAEDRVSMQHASTPAAPYCCPRMSNIFTSLSALRTQCNPSGLLASDNQRGYSPIQSDSHPIRSIPPSRAVLPAVGTPSALRQAHRIVILVDPPDPHRSKI